MHNQPQLNQSFLSNQNQTIHPNPNYSSVFNSGFKIDKSDLNEQFNTIKFSKTAINSNYCSSKIESPKIIIKKQKSDINEKVRIMRSILDEKNSDAP